MKFFIEIDSKKIEVDANNTIFEAAKSAGIDIPLLCNATKKSHRAGCMICAVYDVGENKFLPSCEAKVRANMRLESQSEMVFNLRKNSLLLLLEEHKGDCIAPCQRACPYGFDIPKFLENLTAKKIDAAKKMLETPPNCEACAGLCQKVCRKNLINESVKIIELIKANMPRDFSYSAKSAMPKRYLHAFGKPSKEDIEAMQNSSNDINGCLQCHCKKSDDCALRILAEKFNISKVNNLNIKNFGRVRANGVVYEKGKCILCAACTHDEKLSIRGRACAAQIDKPIGKIWEECLEVSQIEICPTGAIAKDATR